MSTRILSLEVIRGLRSFFIMLLFGLSISPAALLAQGNTRSSEKSALEVKEELEQVISLLSTIRDDELHRRAVRKDIRETFSRASKLFVYLVNHPEIEDTQERQMAQRLSEAIVEAFKPLADEFQDPMDTTHFLRAHEDQTNRFLKVVYQYGGGLLYAGSEMFGRDLASAFVPYRDHRWMLPPGLPLVGRDAAINRLVKSVFKDLVQAFETEVKSSGTDQVKVSQARVILSDLCEKMLHLEPIRYGPMHRLVANFYLWIMVPVAWHFPLEIWPVRTEYGPDVFGVLEAAFFVWMWRVRVNNSGVNSFRIFNRMRRLAGLGPVRLESSRCDSALSASSRFGRR